MNRKLTPNWVLVCATIIGFTFATEWAVRLFAPQALIHALVRHDPIIEKRNVPFGRTAVKRRDGGRHDIILNSDGFRMDQEIHPPFIQRPVLVYGGSALFASHLPLETSIFGLLRALTEKKNERIQLVNAAVPGHGIRSTRLLMKEQIQKFQPAALIYIFDAGPFSQTLISGDRSEINRLRYNKSGQPKLADIPRPNRFEYLSYGWTLVDWFHRHSHLISLLANYINRALVLERFSTRKNPAEVQLSELPWFAQESTDIQELLYLSELHFQSMVRMTKAANVPLLLIWLPARVELTSDSQSSALADILITHRRMLRRLSTQYEKLDFWDSFRSHGEELSNTDHLFISNRLDNNQLSAVGSNWFSNKIGPTVQHFLQAVFEGQIK